MLKIDRPYRFTKDEWLHVKNILIPYIRQYGGKKAWEKKDNATLALKNKISNYTILKQKNKCVYCEDLITFGAQLDHIAPKQQYPDYCYEPKNLVTSCPICNMYIKNADDPIVVHNPQRYELNIFQIVHPYFNDPEQHIKYINGDRVILDTNHCSTIGKATITMFKLDSYPAYCKRAINYGDLSKYPVDFKRLARECSSYRP